MSTEGLYRQVLSLAQNLPPWSPKMLGKRKYSSSTAAAGKKARATRTRRRTITAMLLSREPKFVETAVNTLSVTNVAQIFNLNEIGQGDNYMNRQGNVIQAKYLQFRYSCNMTNQAVAQCANFKMALVLDRNPQGSAPRSQRSLTVQCLRIALQ